MNEMDLHLADLGELRRKTKESLENEFYNSDVMLSDGFKQAYIRNLKNRRNDQIFFYERTSEIQKSGGLKIFLPNQWFVLAAISAEFTKEIIKYRNITEQVIGTNLGRLNRTGEVNYGKKEIYKALKEKKDTWIADAFKEAIEEYLRENDAPDEIVEQDTELLYKFVSDFEWWSGGKTLDRTNDFYVSPTISTLGLVQDSQSYVAEIVYDYARDDELYQEAKELIKEQSANRNRIRYETGYKSEFARNRIFFGAPGTGKSFRMNQEMKTLLQNGGEYERVTFHPDYSYANFVGTYKPVPCVRKDGSESITYDYVPGPFCRVLAKALKNGKEEDAKPYVLIIEEINRANTAAVFGDVFQLLDRNTGYVSEYPIHASEDVRKYLAIELGGKPEEYAEIRIPDNMFIWATMNSADQGVFPMDTAFKRRWDFMYIGVDENEDKIPATSLVLGEGEDARRIQWNNLRKAINEQLLTYGVNEDKLMGTFFISKNVMDSIVQDGGEVFKQVFKDKVIMYLFNDAAKRPAPDLFKGCTNGRLYSAICRDFDKRGVNIFCETIRNLFVEKP